MQYFSQAKQDYFIDKILRGKTRGFFLDIGAYDGMNISNSRFFEIARDWEGLCIEPIPEIFKKLKRNRNCLCLNGAVTETDGVSQFTEVHGGVMISGVPLRMLSGINKYRHDKHKALTKGNISTYGGEIKTIQVKTYSMKTIFEKFNLKKIDYLSLDIEGGEYEILSSIDFKAIDITCLTVENQYRDARVRKLMRKAGYYLMAKIELDDFYVKREYFHKALSTKPIPLLLTLMWMKALSLIYSPKPHLSRLLKSNKMTRKFIQHVMKRNSRRKTSHTKTMTKKTCR